MRTAELYTALQTGTVDGQDNPLVNSRLMKFDEVTSQFVLTRHVIGYDVMAIRSKIWDAMKPEQQAKFQAAADKAMDDNTANFNKQEAEVLDQLDERLVDHVNVRQSGIGVFTRQRKMLEVRPAAEQNALRVEQAGGFLRRGGFLINEIQQVHQICRG